MSQSDWGTRCHPGCPPAAPRGVPVQAAACGTGRARVVGCHCTPRGQRDSVPRTWHICGTAIAPPSMLPGRAG